MECVSGGLDIISYILGDQVSYLTFLSGFLFYFKYQYSASTYLILRGGPFDPMGGGAMVIFEKNILALIFAKKNNLASKQSKKNILAQ